MVSLLPLQYFRRSEASFPGLQYIYKTDSVKGHIVKSDWRASTQMDAYKSLLCACEGSCRISRLKCIHRSSLSSSTHTRTSVFLLLSIAVLVSHKKGQYGTSVYEKQREVAAMVPASRNQWWELLFIRSSPLLSSLEARTYVVRCMVGME